jgi:predicted transcriptional regulator of viral defense system
MYLWEAAKEALLKADVPLVTEYDLYVLVHRIIEDGLVESLPIKPFPRVWDRAKCRKLLSNLERKDTLVPDEDFKAGVWRLVQSTRSASAEDACCIVDPFAYVSHLSAMHLYGLTDRAPLALHLTTPATSVWSRMRKERMARDLGSNIALINASPLNRVTMAADAVRRRPIKVHTTSHPVVPVSLADGFARAAPIGHVFASMLAEPEVHGGIRHAIEVWEASAELWLDEIITAVDSQPTKLAKVRAGYVLSELMGVEDDRIKAWRAFAQRGGSQKLDPEAPYIPRWSDEWMISLNI